MNDCHLRCYYAFLLQPRIIVLLLNCMKLFCLEYGDGSLEKNEKPKMRFCADADGNAKVVRNQRYPCF